MPKLILHQARFVQWACDTFSIKTAAEAADRITELDTLAETVTVDGQEHTIPGECYMTWDEMEAIPTHRREQDDIRNRSED